MENVSRRLTSLQHQLEPTQAETPVYGKKGFEKQASHKSSSTVWSDVPQACPCPDLTQSFSTAHLSITDGTGLKPP